MHTNILKHRTAQFFLLIVLTIGLNYTLLAESKDLPKVLTNRITLKVDKVSLKITLDQIAKKGKFSIIYSNVNKLTSTIVSLNVQNQMVRDVFKDLLTPLNFSYQVVDDKIVISYNPSTVSLLASKFDRKQIDIKGKVTDNQGNPLSGATVKVQNSPQATATDKDGFFILQNVDETAIITISSIGYTVKELHAEKDLGIISLEISSSKLNEVKINAGYYSVTDRERTGSISKVTAATIGENPVDNPLMALEGRVPGLQITQRTGVPGGGLSVQIRGQNSIKNGNDPLYIIDGVTYPSTRISGESTSTLLGKVGANTGTSPLSTIDPDEIESIEILKDADATAIYGSRGANGVILITTKKGKPGDTKVTAAISQGFSQVAHRIDLLNTDQYIAMRKEALKNDGLSTITTDYDINGTWDQTKYIDWQKELIGGTAHNTNASLSLTGGTAKSNYLVAGNYDQEGTVFPGDFGFKRMGFRSNINLGSAEDRFNASFTANYSHTESNLFASNIVTNIFLPPDQPDAYNIYGKLNWGNGTTNTVYTNPMAAILQTSNAGTDNLVTDLTLSYLLLKNLYVKASIGYSTIKRQELQETPLASFSPLFNYTSTQRTSLFSNNFSNTFLAEPIITYKFKAGAGEINALVGMSFQNNNYQLSTISAKDFTSDDLMQNLASAATLTNSSSTYSQYHYAAGYARVNYSLADKYFINLTARRDGSSRFGPGKQFANFGAIGTGWIFSEEKFIKEKLPLLSFGKLRASYGITGNDQIGDYQYLQLWSSNLYGTYQGTPTLAAAGPPNADFAWETNRKLEAALQLGFLKDRINIEIAFYRNRSSNQLLYQTLPLSTGLGGGIIRNLPADVQNTGWEFDSSFKILRGQDWQWTTAFNLTIPKNKLLSYPGLSTSTDAINYEIGQPLSILKAYNVSVNSQTGLYVFEDKNNSGTLDDADRYVIKYIGQSYYGGLQNSLKFKKITLDFLFSFTKQTGQSYQALSSLTPGRYGIGGTPNQFSAVLDRWQQAGDVSSVQKFTTTSANNTLNTNAKALGNVSIVDASYIKLRNISLSYTLPKNWLTALKINNATLSVQGQNLFTITKYVGLDPETQSFSLPPLRTIMMGLNITF
jgi:TonB-linked SusC/RagA family outer membrane protein